MNSRHLTEDQLHEIQALLADKENTYKIIGATYSIPEHQVKRIGMRMGLQRRQRGGDRISKTATLSSVDLQIEAQRKAMEKANQEIQRLMDLREALSVRFEWEGREVLVYGITDEVPVKATAAQWVRFLSAEGPRRLREFIEKRNKQ